MIMKNKQRIGLFGYGVVGHGLYEIITGNTQLNIELVKICAKHPEKKRNISLDNFTFDRDVILKDKSIDLIVEAIDDADASFEIVSTALKSGKNVVSANKKMISEHLEELVSLQKDNGTSLLYEASACASIPIVRTLEEFYDNDLLNSVSGIFNGSTNFILTKIFNENKDYDLALKQAQDLGFVERNPDLDIVGYDALYKLLIVTAHAYGIFVKPEDVVVHGIQYISKYDIEYAQERGAKVKQIATVRKFGQNKIAIYVIPQFVFPDHDLFDVEYEFNAVTVEAAFSQSQFFKGKGAGGHPTGFAMFADISAMSYNYKYEYKKHLSGPQANFSNDYVIEVYFRYYDEKNLAHFNFEEISARYTSKEFSYVIGTISMKALHEKLNILNTADIFVVSTGRLG